jgi:hypothetical protein
MEADITAQDSALQDVTGLKYSRLLRLKYGWDSLGKFLGGD